MGFLSYAQNFEDVMLWRALKHVEAGLYVDVGAQHPRIDSISRAFYENGWRGVHIEPVPAFAEMMRKDRPDETVLQVALGDTEGTLELNVFADTGLSTAVQSYAERHQAERGYETQRIQVPLMTMKSALGFLAGKDVHWLKIDVEGFEEQVLRGWDSSQLRPWVLVVEATIPNSPESDHEKWDPLVQAAGYRFVYFDGLNRFYIASEHPELAAAFAAPPNIFDAVEVSGEASWGLCNLALAQHQARAEELSTRLAAVEEEASRSAASAEERIAELDHQVAALSCQLAHSLAESDIVRQSLAHSDNLAQERYQRTQSLIDEHARRYQTLASEHAAAHAKAEELKHTSYYWWHTAEELRAQASAAEEQLRQIHSSRSWRLSAPLRLLGVRARVARRFVGRAVRWALRQPNRVRRLLGNKGAVLASGKAAPSVVVMSHAASGSARRLAPRAARVYAELKEEVEKGNQ